MNRCWYVLWLVAGSAAAQGTLVNPLLPSGADPWITSRNGFYYYMNSMGSSLVIWKTKNIGALATAEKKTVWRPPASGPYSRDIWAPELHFLRGKWYIYFAADGGRNESHRIWVLENAAADPLDGEWQMKGKMADPSDRWAIDATVFEHDSRIYMVWSGWEGEVNGAQNLYIAELSDPYTVKGNRVRISSPEYPWEKIGDLKPRVASEANPGADPRNPIHVDVNEGPEILQHGSRIFRGLLCRRVLDRLLFAGDAHGFGIKRPDGSGVVEEKLRAGVLALSRGSCLRYRPQQLLPVSGRQGGLDPVSCEFRVWAGVRQSPFAARAAVHLEAGRNAGFRPAGRGGGADRGPFGCQLSRHTAARSQ